MPLASELEEMRQKIAAQTREYISAGGRIEIVAPGKSNVDIETGLPKRASRSMKQYAKRGNEAMKGHPGRVGWTG